VSRRLLIVAFGLALPFAWAWPALADQNVQIRDIDSSDFPSVAVTVSVQGSTGLSASEVRVLENDVPVNVTSVRPLGPSTDQGVDVVLAIDTSHTMEGAPLQTAYAAAREFVTKIPPWIRVGILTFAPQPQVVQPVTSDHGVVLGSLASPPSTAYGTSLYDAIAMASGMFSGTGQRNIILLSDGRNTTGKANFSNIDVQAAVAAAHDARATIFSVGLGKTDVAILQQVSQLTHGSYVTASLSDLDAAYRTLARQLAQQYLITYRSKAPFGTQAIVTVELPGGTDVSGFLAPPPHATVGTANTPTALARFFSSPLAVVTTVGLTFLAALSLISLLFGVQMRAGREKQLAHAMAAPPRIRSRARPKPEGSQLTWWIPQPVVGTAARVAEYTGLAAWTEVRLERAGLAMRPGEFLAGTVIASLACGLVGGVVSRNIVVALVLVVLGALVPMILLVRASAARARQLQAQLPDVLMVIASSMRAGHSFLQALDMVTKEVGEPSAHEFTRAVTEIRLGRPVDEALQALAERTGSEDFRWSVMAINIQRQVGGNLAELLETVAGTIRERETLRRQVRVLSAEGRLSVVILTLLPFLIAGYLFVVKRDYLAVLFQTSIGRILLVGSGLLMLIGYAWMHKVVSLDV